MSVDPYRCLACKKVDGMPRWRRDGTDGLGRLWMATQCPHCGATTRRPTTPLAAAYPVRRA